MNEVCDLEVGDWAPKRARLMVTPTLGFSEEDTRVIAPERNFLIKHHPRELSWSTHCLKSQCIRY